MPPPPKHSTLQLVILSVKSMLGTGLLALPFAMKESGILLGPFLLIFTAYLAYRVMIMVQEILDHQLEPKVHPTIVDLAQTPTLYYCGIFSLFGAQLMICASYLSYIGHTMVILFPQFKFWEYVLITTAILLVPALLFQSIDLLKQAANFSLAALAATCILVWWYGATTYDKRHHKLEYFNPLGGIFSFGIAVFSYEGIHMVPVIAQKALSRFRKVSYLSLFFSALSYLGFGVSSYILWGQETQATLFESLPASLDRTIIGLLLCASLFFTYYIQIFPVFCFLGLVSEQEEYILPKNPNDFQEHDALIQSGKSSAYDRHDSTALIEPSSDISVVEPQRSSTFSIGGGSSSPFLKNFHSMFEDIPTLYNMASRLFWISITVVLPLLISSFANIVAFAGAVFLGMASFVVVPLSHSMMLGYRDRDFWVIVVIGTIASLFSAILSFLRIINVSVE